MWGPIFFLCGKTRKGGGGDFFFFFLQRKMNEKKAKKLFGLSAQFAVA